MVENNFLSHREAYGKLHKVLMEERAKPFRFLDITCGDASGSADTLTGTPISHYYGIDFSSAALDIARKNMKGLAAACLALCFSVHPFFIAVLYLPMFKPPFWNSFLTSRVCAIVEAAMRDGDMKMKLWAGAAGLFLCLLVQPVAAGQFEDAVAAYGRGEYETAISHWKILAKAEETPHLQFVIEYIREIAEINHLRETAGAELKNTNEDPMMGCIRNMTSLQLEVQSHIAILKGMQLNPPFETAIPSIVQLDEMRLQSYGRYIDACTTLAEGPKPDIDYAAIVAQLPKETAKLDYIDRAQFDATPLFLATLIDTKPDSQNHLSHLIITKDERTKLINQIKLSFGDQLTKKNQNFIVSSAIVASQFLLGSHKSSDDPW